MPALQIEAFPPAIVCLSGGAGRLSRVIFNDGDAGSSPARSSLR